jgi:hypothetical protein
MEASVVGALGCVRAALWSLVIVGLSPNQFGAEELIREI